MALRKRTDAYWDRRSAERLTLAEQKSEPYLKQTLRAYESAKREVIKDLKGMYSAYYSKDEGFNREALNSIAPQGSIKRFRDEMKRLGLPTQLPKNYGGRVTRLELFESQIQAKVDQIGLKQDQIEGKAHQQTIKDAYSHSIYDISKGIGSTPAFNQLDQRTIDKILSAKFDGKNYSERIWKNTDILASQLREKLTRAIATGQSLEKTSREFSERFNVGQSYAKRLIRTETSYFENASEIEAYASMGIEEFVFVATLDGRTSEICQHMDGKRFKVSEAMAGENCPPLHPNCRSTIRAYIGKEWEPETRIYRDPETGKNKYTYNMDYEEWHKEFVGPNVPAGLSTFSNSKMAEYNLLKPTRPPKNIYDKIAPNTTLNPYTEELTIAEISLVNRLEAQEYKVDLIRNVKNKSTKDFKVFNTNWELKTPTTSGEMTIRNVINKATDQNKHYIMVDVSFLDKPMTWVFEKVEKHLSIPKNADKVKGLIIVRGDRFIRYK